MASHCSISFINDLEIDTSGMSTNKEKIDAVIEKGITFEVISNIFKKELLGFCTDDKLKNQYVDKLTKVIYQEGLIYAAAQSLTANPQVAKQGYIVSPAGLQSQVNIYAENEEIYIDEKTQLMSLSEISQEGMGLKAVSNEDKSAMMTLKNRFHLRTLGSGEMEYAHTDLTIEYNSSLVKTLYDKRTLIDKIKDFLKSIFEMNGIEEFSIDDNRPTMSH